EPVPPLRLAEADQREMPQRRHRPALDQADAIAFGPAGEPRPGKLRAPAEAARDRREALLEGPAKPALGAQMIDQDDLAAGLQHADELVERRLRVRHRGDDILRHYRVERGI